MNVRNKRGRADVVLAESRPPYILHQLQEDPHEAAQQVDDSSHPSPAPPTHHPFLADQDDADGLPLISSKSVGTEAVEHPGRGIFSPL